MKDNILSDTFVALAM